MNTKIKTDTYFDESGAVLITALLILALLTIIGVGSVLMTNTEVKISGNLKASSLSLYVAEGGIEVAKTSINSSSSNNFSISPGTTNDTMTGFEYNSGCDTSMTIPCRTITHPLNWFDNTWYEYSAGACTTTTLTNTSDWPVCKNITVGEETTLVTVQKPTWSPAASTKIIFKSITSEHTSSAPNKKISVNFEIDFGNNILAFQVFRDNADQMTKIDNIDVAQTNNVILSSISSYDWGMGGNPGDPNENSDRITGIYSGDMKIRIDTCDGACATWEPLGIAQKNEANNTFILSDGSGIQCFYSASGYTEIGGAGLSLDGKKFRVVEINPSNTCT